MTQIEKKNIREKLEKLGLSQFSTNYFLEAIDICNRKKIHVVDINLDGVIYPLLEKEFHKPASSIETELVQELKEIWKEKDHKKIARLLNYNKKPTVKKLLIILLLETKKIKIK